MGSGDWVAVVDETWDDFRADPEEFIEVGDSLVTAVRVSRDWALQRRANRDADLRDLAGSLPGQGDAIQRVAFEIATLPSKLAGLPE